MTTRANIETAVLAWLEAATSETVIFAEQGKPRPSTPYLTAKVGNIVSFGQDDRRGMTDPGAPSYATQTYRGDREINVSVQAFGSGAMDLARAAANALRTETTRAQLATAGLCHRGVVPAVNELTELLETDFEERAQFDATLAFGEEYTDTVPLIEDVEGQGTFTGSPTSPRVETFTVSKP
jgi:hypothetical protein